MSGDQPPVGPNPSDEVPETPTDSGSPQGPAAQGVPEGPADQGEREGPADQGAPEAAADHSASGMPSLPPPGGPMHPGEVAAPGQPPSAAHPVNPYTGNSPYVEPERAPLQWILVVVGIPIGFVAWVLASFLLLGLTGTLGWTSGSNALTLVLLVALLGASVGLIVWRRTRRLAQGFVLGAAIGLVVAGGLCIPLVSSF